jgi:hypothetical protein
MSALERDRNGNTITKPVTGWNILALTGTSILLAIQYAETPEELETGHSKQIQLALMLEACLLLAEKLRKAGKSLA